MLALRNVVKTYGKNKVLGGISLDIHPKDCVCIVGDGGSGKSTLLKLLVRAEDPTTGTVEVDGIDLRKVPAAILQLYRRRLGIAFQESMLLMHATVEENISLPLELFGAPPSVIKRTAADLMKRLGLLAKAGRLASDLSMSERSLVGVARAMITAPMIVIADEPLLHLDETQAATVTELLRNMHKHGTTLILLSRDAATAKAFGARTIHLKEGKFAHTQKAKEPERKQAVKAADTHRILEETGHKSHAAAEELLNTPQPQKPERDGKKIRITSIGSGL